MTKWGSTESSLSRRIPKKNGLFQAVRYLPLRQYLPHAGSGVYTSHVQKGIFHVTPVTPPPLPRLCGSSTSKEQVHSVRNPGVPGVFGQVGRWSNHDCFFLMFFLQMRMLDSPSSRRGTIKITPREFHGKIVNQRLMKGKSRLLNDIS